MGASRGSRWPGGIVPYTVSPNFTDVNALSQAIAKWEATTNLRFIRRLPDQDDFVDVQNSANNCQSAVGRQGGRQTVGCAPFGFGVASIIHELGHAVGLIHEHRRSDRGTFVTIQPANIQAGKGGNFTRIANSRNGPVYDFQSIMHYGPNAFSNGGGPTIVPVVAGTVLNGSTLPTALDAAWVNTEYPTLGVVRRSDSASGAGGIGELAVAVFSGSADRLIIAVRTVGGRLKLIEWRVSSLGGIGRISDSGNAAGSATHIDIARDPTSNTFVTALRTDSGNLKLISWAPAIVMNRRIIQRQGDSGNAAGAATQIRIVALTNTAFVTACRTSQGRLLLISWRLNADGSLTRLADSGTAAGEAKSVAMIVIRNSGADHLVATTVRTANDRLRVIAWNVNSSSGAIARLGDSGNAVGPGDQRRYGDGPLWAPPCLMQDARGYTPGDQLFGECEWNIDNTPWRLGLIGRTHRAQRACHSTLRRRLGCFHRGRRPQAHQVGGQCCRPDHESR